MLTSISAVISRVPACWCRTSRPARARTRNGAGTAVLVCVCVCVCVRVCVCSFRPQRHDRIEASGALGRNHAEDDADTGGHTERQRE
jgi:hypothetical protein